jgi:hypothetical protein
MSSKREKEEPFPRSTTNVTTLTPSKTMDHLSDPTLLLQGPAQQTEVNDLDHDTLGFSE